MTERVFAIIIKTDSEETVEQIRKDIEYELSCCYNTIEVKGTIEIEE